MKRSMKHSSSLKAKNNGQIHLLEDKLFSTLRMNEESEPKYDDLEFQMINDKPDSLSELITKAKGITQKNQEKIQKAKRQLKVSKKEAAGTFLTGTGIYAEDVQEPDQIQDYEPIEDIDHDAMLRELTKKGEYDDLAELRRMIKVTGQNLDGYSREVLAKVTQVFQIKKDVMHAANQFKSQMDFGLTYKLNRLEGPANKKTQSINGLRGNRYK